MKKSSFGKKLFWTTALGVTLYGGATYAALHNEAFYDTYTTYVPGGEQVLDAIEDAMHDAEFKKNLDAATEWKNTAVSAAGQVQGYAMKAKDTAADLYEYAQDAYAQFTGDKDAPKIPSSDGSIPATTTKRRKFSRRGAIFSNVIETDQDAPVPQFKPVGEPKLDELAATIQTLVKMLNEIGLKGHAKRLADYGSHEVEQLYREYRKVCNDEDRVLKDIKELVNESGALATHVEKHLEEMDAKVLAARERSIDRVQEKKDKIRREFAIEAEEIKKEYQALAIKQLNTQHEEFKVAMAKELEERAVELNRQFMRQVRQKVETERGGKLARVDEVAVRQRLLEQLSYQNAEDLDDSRKAHQLVAAVDALKRAAYAGNQQAFLDELQTLLVISAPASPFADLVERRNDELVQVVARSISETVARHGIDSKAQLEERFANVAAEVRHASLIPEEGSSMISHIISIIMSKLMFKKQGLVPGDDLESRMARAEYYLERENDLESATREVNQLKGWPKHLAADWLDAARRHLEIKQALEVSKRDGIESDGYPSIHTTMVICRLCGHRLCWEACLNFRIFTLLLQQQ